jgi:hypothetical protein
MAKTGLTVVVAIDLVPIPFIIFCILNTLTAALGMIIYGAYAERAGPSKHLFL